MIERLVDVTGNFRDLLGYMPGQKVDLSSPEWGERAVIVRRVAFDHMAIRRTKFVANFVECSLEACEFDKIISSGNFGGAANQWRHCRFWGCELKDMIAPQSRFIDCQFSESKIQGLRLCHTTFAGCTFSGVAIQGLVARQVGDRRLQLDEVSREGASALFKGCTFIGCSFVGCNFADICFKECQVEDSRFDACSFERVVSKDKWLATLESVDSFIVFLDAAIDAIEKRLGSQSKSCCALAEYRSDYQEKKTTSKDYSAVLYDGRVPDQELDVVETVLDSVEALYRF